eukprot:1143517-Pelagomonas_calceolata.AAC.9
MAHGQDNQMINWAEMRRHDEVLPSYFPNSGFEKDKLHESPYRCSIPIGTTAFFAALPWLQEVLENRLFESNSSDTATHDLPVIIRAILPRFSALLNLLPPLLLHLIQVPLVDVEDVESLRHAQRVQQVSVCFCVAVLKQRQRSKANSRFAGALPAWAAERTIYILNATHTTSTHAVGTIRASYFFTFQLLFN